MTQAPKKRVKKYVNNADLLTQIKLSKQNGRMTEELGKMIMMLCQKYSTHPTYSNIYYNKEDMVAHAIMVLTKTWKGFNEDKSQNPFAYFTQIAKTAFYQYLNDERDHKLTKDAMLARIIPDDVLMDWYNSSANSTNSNDDLDQHEVYDIDFKESVIVSNIEHDPDKIDIEKELDNTPEEITESEIEEDDDENY